MAKFFHTLVSITGGSNNQELKKYVYKLECGHYFICDHQVDSRYPFDPHEMVACRLCEVGK